MNFIFSALFKQSASVIFLGVVDLKHHNIIEKAYEQWESYQPPTDFIKWSTW